MLKLLTVYLSISGLIYMQMAPAYAQRKDYDSKEEESKGGDKGKEQAQKDLDDLAKKKKEEDAKKKKEGSSIDKETDDTKVTEASEDTASIVMTVLFLLVIMITAPLWVISCPKPDTGIHAIAGVIAIVLEGVFWGLYEKGSKTALEIYEKDAKEGYDIQLNSMKTAMEITQKAKTWMTAKFGVQIAIAVIIGIAMAVVLIMSIIQSVRSLGVETPIAQNCATSYNDSPFKSFDASKLYTSRGEPFDWAMSKYENFSRFSNSNDLGELAFVNDEMERVSRGEINSAPFSDYDILKNDKEINSVVAENQPIFSQFKTLMNDVGLIALAHAATPTDEADASTETGDKSLNAADIGSKLAAIGVVVPSLIAAIVLKVSTTWTFTAFNGWIRAGFYAAEIVFVSVVASFSKKTADELGRRADAYQDLYEQLTNIMANQPGKDGKTQAPMPPQQIYKNAGNAAVAEMDGKCFTGSGTGEATPDPSCGCKASKSCKKTNMPKMNFPDFKTPSVLASSAKLAGDMGDQMYSGDMRGASLSAQGLGRNAVAVKKMNDRLMALANSKMAEFGKPPIDFDKNKNDMISKFKNAASSTWGSLSDAQQKEAIQAVMGGAASEKKEETEVASVGPSGGKGGAGSGAGAKKKGIFDFVGGEDEKAKLQAGAEKEKEAKGLDEYEDSTKQITEGGDKNLFKIIEIRYMKSAYPVFFESKDK
jgi:hypothetical protein